MRLNMRPIDILFISSHRMCRNTWERDERGNKWPAFAQDYPAKPVRMIEPFGAGGGPDLLARALAQKLSELWGQPVTVENIPGAGATAGPAQVAKSPADGYTLLINTSAQAYSAALLEEPPV